MTRAIKDLLHLVEAQYDGERTDRELLERFAAQRDEAAFALLVRRHGPMVLGVCRRVLRHHHDAEDACQAAFLVLARKAGSVRWHDSAGGYLFQVAYRLALKMKAAGQHGRTQPLTDQAGASLEAKRPDGELRAILDEELSRLPAKYRTPLLLCHDEGKTRAEAARQLGWKEGAVKIRLERGRALLRARLSRRGVAPIAVVSALLAEKATAYGLPAALVEATVSTARSFATGPARLAGPTQAVALAEGVLRTMMMTRLKLVAMLLAVILASVGAGLWAHGAFAEQSAEVTPPRQADRPAAPQDEPGRKPVPAQAAAPLRVLLMGGGPTREYQYVRNVFLNEMNQKRADPVIYLQSNPATVQDVPPERLLRKFPSHLDSRAKKDADDRYDNLAHYDLVIAFDADWSMLSDADRKHVEQWVGEQGHGLIFVAGPINTFQLVRPGQKPNFKPILDILPVNLIDLRIVEERDTNRPRPLGFPASEKFLQLDDGQPDALAGWSEFFFGKPRADWLKTTDEPVRGFYSPYPVKNARAGAVVLATFRDPKTLLGNGAELPYLVTLKYGKGRTVYLGSGETWRLRQFRADFHERFWSQLARYAAEANPAEAGKPGRPDGKGELDGCSFLGAPMPVAGKLYVLIEKQQELRLACIDPAHGKVIRTQALATTDKGRIQTANLAYGEGMLVCPTNAGAILGIDVLSNNLAWAYSYREKGDGQPSNPDGSNHGQWQVSAPVIQDGKVIFTASDARSVHCINLRDGSRVWTQKRLDDDLYLGGVHGGKVIIVGKKTCRALSLSKGETLWTVDTGISSGQRAPEPTAEQRKALDRGLRWLVRAQLRNGQWEPSAGRNSTTTTSLAAMALLMQGSTIKDGEHADALRRAVDWLMLHAKKNGVMGIFDNAEETEKFLDGHAHAMLLLASIHGEDEDHDRRRKLEMLLTRAVAFTVMAQTSQGGWGHVERGLEKAEDDRAAVAPTVLHLQALQAVRNAGIAVPRAALASAQAYLVKHGDPATPNVLPGLLGILALGGPHTPLVKDWLPPVRKLAPTFDQKAEWTAEKLEQLFAFAQIVHQLGDDGYARLLPDSKPEERITWTAFRKQAFEYLLKTQQRDGFWGKEGDAIHATALALAILQLDSAVVPVYQR
jgi:RNA polymerase sigma factor (sigma-70 family)